MSEELNSAAAATIPATETTTVESTPVVETTTPTDHTDPLANATPAPAPVAEAPAPAVVDQAAIDSASATTEAPADNGGNEAPAPVEEPKKEEAAAAEQPPTPAEQVVTEITEDLINTAIEAIKATRKSGIATLQRKLQIGYNQVVKILDTLTERGLLGPQEGNTPRKILMELPPEQPKVTVKPQPKKQFKGKPRMTDYDRMQSWKEHLKDIGHYTDQGLIDALADYAQRNPGFNPRAKWGSCLIVMINRLSGRLLNSLRTFTQTDADNLVKELLRFFAEQPLGDNAIAWNEKFQTNMEQKKAISQFFDIDKSYRDLRGSANLCLTAVRDAAWPTKDEEVRGTGGTFAERFHYLALCIVKFGSSDFSKALFENSFHTEPTDDFLNRVGGVRRPAAPSWIKDGHCVECGNEVVKDSRGNDICSNPICEHHFASVATEVAKSFRQGNKPRRHDDMPNYDPAQAPLPVPDGERRRNWKDKKDRRHGDDEGDFPRGGKFRKHGKRWHQNEGDDVESHGDSQPVSEGRTFHVGDEFPGNSPFAGLNLPKVEEPPKADAPAGEQLPPPPAEVPVA